MPFCNILLNTEIGAYSLISFPSELYPGCRIKWIGSDGITPFLLCLRLAHAWMFYKKTIYLILKVRVFNLFKFFFFFQPHQVAYGTLVPQSGIVLYSRVLIDNFTYSSSVYLLIQNSYFISPSLFPLVIINLLSMSVSLLQRCILFFSIYFY